MISEWIFGTTIDGGDVTAFELVEKGGLKAVILTQGAILQSLYLPDGRNVVLGHETLEGYIEDRSYLGQIIGRNANRVVGSQFEIDGIIYPLFANDGENNLHSGPEGFGRQNWRAEQDDNALILRHVSPDGDQGFPGSVNVELRISVRGMSLRLEMTASTTKPCPVNLTWHPYWNLIGEGRIDGHDLSVSSDYRTNLELEGTIPVRNTRFDFRTPLPLGHVEIDHNYADVDKATLSAQDTTMTLTSSLPDMQVYTGDNLSNARSGVALEPQFRPNDINLNQDCLLRPGEVYHHWIEYSFNVD